MAKIRMIDIAVNFTDSMFKGIYNGKQCHLADISAVLSRAWSAGVDRIIVTGGSLEESKEALAIAETDARLFCTVGVHPTRCNEFDESGDPEKHFQALLSLAKEGVEKGKVVAIGECGLDYDRVHFCPREIQKKYFEKQFELAHAMKLPMFLHMRAAAEDFCHILEQNKERFSAGVAHSFTGSAKDRDRLLSFSNLFIGVNGCSLKTPENLDVVRSIPVERMMIETDSPYCEIKNSHAGISFVKSLWPSKKKEKYDQQCIVKGRNEPCLVRQVLEVVAGCKGIKDLDQLSMTLYHNTCRVFFPHDLDSVADALLAHGQNAMCKFSSIFSAHISIYLYHQTPVPPFVSPLYISPSLSRYYLSFLNIWNFSFKKFAIGSPGIAVEIMYPAPIEPTSLESSTVPSSSHLVKERNLLFGNLRGVQWRIDLGILPASSSTSPTSPTIDDLRRVTANSRRRYAALRRRLLIDPHIPKDGSNSPDLVMDNPLSQNPDSMWGRFFRNAELERTLDQDLSRLYPEHGSYFQTPGCQGMLRRILLLWCLRHPDYGYRQGMHELLAPLLYVLHVDVQHLSEVRKLYEDHFTDKFDGFSFHESDFTYRFDFKKFSDFMEDEIGPQKSPSRVGSLSELDPKIQAIILLSDAYGAEGELGIVLSEKFMEHDAYCMFDALMNGAGGAVAMADFFSHSPLSGPLTGLPPVIEASSALYHLLSIVDPSLHSHLVELGVEPQYFSLRWLRVLFGREFALEDLLIIWDEIFASDNCKLNKFADNGVGSSFGVLNSSRGAFISALAVSMILHLRSSLLATENATSCLQRLLNFPEDIKLEKLIAKAKSLQGLAVDANSSSSLPTYTGAYNQSKSVIVRGHSLSSDTVSPRTALSMVPESYWEEKWRVLHKEEESREGSIENKVPNRIKGWSEKVKLRLSRTESDPSPSKVNSKKTDHRSSVRRSLLKDLAKQLGSEEDSENVVCGEDVCQKDRVEECEQNGSSKNFSCTGDDRCLNGNAGSEENSSVFSDPSSPISGANDQENRSESSVASNLSIDENDVEQIISDSSRTDPEASPLPISDSPDEVCLKSKHIEDSTGKSETNMKDRKLLSGKFQWFWKLGRNVGEGTSEKGGLTEATKASVIRCNQLNEVGSSTIDGFDSSSLTSKGDAVDQIVMVTFRNLGQSMLENIQVIESAFQQDQGQAGALENYSKNGLVGRGQVTALAALKELRKISNLLSET